MQEKQENSSKKCKSFRSPNDNLHKHEYMRKYDNSPNGAIVAENHNRTCSDSVSYQPKK